MLNIDILNSFIKEIFINLFIFYLFVKIINYKEIKRIDKIIVLIFSVLLAIIYIILLNFLQFSQTNIICLFIDFVFIKFIAKQDIIYTLIVMLLSTAMTFSIFILSSVICAFVFQIMHNDLNNNPIGLFIIVMVELFFIYRLFNIKRFKNRIFIYEE